MKSVLAFGDSLTWGMAPSGERHVFADRWPTLLEAGFKGAGRVLAEGLNGRTTMYDDHGGPADRNGARLLPTLLASHTPLDAVVIMLGTNDLKPHICGTAWGAALGIRRLCEIVRHHPYDKGSAVPAIIVVAPPHSMPQAYAGQPALQEQISDQSRRLAGDYARIARENNATFFDASTVARPDPADGIHLDAANTRAIGAALVPIVRNALGA